MAKSAKEKYDVFVSYSHTDKDWVRNILLPMLEENNIKVCIDYRDFRPGSPSITEMESAVLQSKKMIAVLSPSYVSSAWGQFEAILMGTLDPSAQESKILPVLIKSCEIPLRLRYLTYVNMIDSVDMKLEMNRLLGALNKTTNLASQPKRGVGGEEKGKQTYSADFLVRLRDVLMSCDELETDAQLRALFNENQLKGHKARVPQASTIAERVDLLIDYLLNRRLVSGETLLTVFLNALRKRISVTDERYDIIGEILQAM